jgi:hypothetical protein
VLVLLGAGLAGLPLPLLPLQLLWMNVTWPEWAVVVALAATPAVIGQLVTLIRR